MTAQLLLYFSAGFIAFWGIAHLSPTRSVIQGFGDISRDNQRIIAMEWITEAVALIFIGTLVMVVTWVDHHSAVSMAVYRLVFIVLNVLSIVSFFTGFRINFLPYKLCPLIFSTASVLIIIGAYIG
jgi:hypothetical protein